MPEWLTNGAVERLLESGAYVRRRIGDQDVVEPPEGRRGPAYVYVQEMNWWQFIYDVAVGTGVEVDVLAEVLVC